jgi:hypothetical protein
MSRYRRVQTFVLVVGAVAAPGCSATSDREPGNASGRDSDNGTAIDRHAIEADKDAEALAAAANAFVALKTAQLAVLSARYDLVAPQPDLIWSIAHSFPLTEVARATVVDKARLFQARVDELGNTITGLRPMSAEQWHAEDARVPAAIKDVEDTRSDSWNALSSALRERNPTKRSARL